MSAAFSLKVFATRDPELLGQYYELRSRKFSEHYPGVPEDFGHEEVMDHRSQIVVACAEGRVYGGARLTVRYSGQRPWLPLEAAGFELPPLAHYEHSHDRGFGEISRLAIECKRPAELAALPVELVKELARVSAAMGLDVCFSICPRGPALLNSRVCRQCGILFQIHTDIPARRLYEVDMQVCSYQGIQRLFGKAAAR